MQRQETVPTLPEGLFRRLAAEEANQFRKWAQDNYDASKQADEAWHPVVRHEWQRLRSRSAEKLLERALARVESESLREWATNEHNRPLWIQIAEKYLGKEDAESWLCADIVATAIGL